MAAVNLEAARPLEQSTSGVVTTRRLEGTLVAPRATKSVPNHLADTKIFSKTQRNGILQTKPGVIHFSGYEVGKVQQQTLQIINASRDNQQMHIIPPTTSFFSIKYSKKRSSLVPGLSLDVVVEFKPKEWRYYYDCIRVHCKGEQNLLIPIHAYPVINTTKFPRHIKFPSTPLGQTRKKTVSLECGVPIDFEYQLSYLQNHPSFTVEPMKGVVPANGKVDIIITFTPAEYNTAVFELKLELSQFNSNPLLCTITGSSSPGLAADHLKLETVRMTQQLKQQKLTLKSTGTPHHLPPLDRTTKHTQRTVVRKKSSQSNTTQPLKTDEDATIIQDGYRFPANLDTPGAIGKVLAQQPGKAKASELRQAASQTTGVGEGVATQQIKEAVFLQEVRQAVVEERANKLRWVTKLGGVATSDEEKESILKARQEAETQYQRHRHVVVPSEEYHRRGTGCVRRRTRRRAREHSTHIPTFDPYNNDAWKRRFSSLQRFVQAARRVVVQVRCQERLSKLQRLTSQLKEGKSMEESLADISGKDSEVVDLISTLPINTDHIQPFTFPKYEPEQSVDEEGNLMVGGVALKQFDVKPIDVDYHLQQYEEHPILKLKVPLEYERMGYKPLPFPEMDSYIPPGLPRKLRTGALEELENLGHIPGVNLCFLTPDAFTSLPPGAVIGKIPPTTQTEAESSTNELFTGGAETDKAEGEEGRSQLLVQDIEERREFEGRVVPIKPPTHLFKTPQLHPLHIFYPAPGVMSYVPMLPHSEVSLDHALLPLPTYPSSKHPQVRLDPLSVIPGVMQWKTFPSHCLIAMDGEKKISSVWRPRRSDPFSSELLPVVSSPELLSGPQHDDLVDLENFEVQPVPTMEMVRSQFNLQAAPAPAIKLEDCNATGDVNRLSTEPVTLAHNNDCAGLDLRELAEKSLAEERASQLNLLGGKIEERWNTYRELLGSQTRVTLGSAADFDSV